MKNIPIKTLLAILVGAYALNVSAIEPATLKRLMQGLIAGLENQGAVYPVEKGTTTPVKPILP